MADKSLTLALLIMIALALLWVSGKLGKLLNLALG